MNKNCIEVIGLTYLNIFKNFNIAFEEGKFINVSGPNNCGKTTLIRIIDNQLRTDNSVLIYGKKQENYKLTELSALIKTIIPLEITFIQNTVEEELLYQLSDSIPKNVSQEKLKTLSKKFKINKYLKKPVDTLPNDVIVRLQLALAFITHPQIVLIDDLAPYFDKKELIEITKAIKEIKEEYNITIIMIASNLSMALISDYIYVIDNSEIIIEGNPYNVLEKDNILNKAGLNLPFMMDLSVKLRDYDLIKNIELDMDRMVDTLWN